MNVNALSYLLCPQCKGALKLFVLEQERSDVVRGALSCLDCNQKYEIRDGLAYFSPTDTLTGSDLSNQKWYDMRSKYDPRFWSFRLGIWEITFMDSHARLRIIKKLEPKKGDHILEIGAGNGRNFPIIVRLIGDAGQLDGLDLSGESLKVARKRVGQSYEKLEVVQGNASCLPYRSNQFDSVMHIGGANDFTEKHKAIKEMIRVAKNGAKIVICDEGLSPERKETLLGKWIMKCAPGAFEADPPVDLLPDNIKDFKLSWVWQGTTWLTEFRK